MEPEIRPLSPAFLSVRRSGQAWEDDQQWSKGDRWRSMESLLAQRAKEDARRACLRASRLLWRQLEDVRHSAELWKRTGLHLSHQVGAMHLHRGFSDADVVG